MKVKLYKKLSRVSVLALLILIGISKTNAQSEGLYADTVKWPNTNTISINLRTTAFNKVFVANGTLTWNKNSLQFTSITGGSTLGTSNFTFNTTNAASQGYLSYLFFDGALNGYTVPNGTIAMTINFTVINNPAATYNNNNIAFSNTPTALEIDTLDGGGNPGAVFFPNVENHISGYVSFARPAVLSNNGTNITDSVTNRPAGCTYQWFQNGVAVAGPASSNYPNAPQGLDSVQITYPNGTVVGSVVAVLPVKLSSFSGKNIENANQIFWSTSTEINTNNFEIQRSENSVDFIAVGKQKAIGNSAVVQNYSFTDASIYNKSTLYYRLKINDNNGAYTYSNIIKIARDSKIAISLYPNPAKGFVTIEGSKISSVSVSDIFGRTVLQKDFNQVNNATLNTLALAKGVYNVSVKNANETVVLKLIIE